jgi:hypothetical protein
MSQNPSILRCCRPLLGLALIGAVFAQEHDPRVLFETYCYDCHGDGLRKGGMALDRLIDAGEGAEQRHQWEKTWKIVRHELMPPADEAQPTEDERLAITRWIEENQFGVDRENPDPGRVTIRRLNRMEYEYTITDLFGVELKEEGTYSSDGAVAQTRLRDMLPPDDTAFGFDNIGDFQTLSPALLEKYFNIAEFVVDQVVSTAGPQVPVKDVSRQLRSERISAEKRTNHRVGLEIEHPGRYAVEVRFSLGGWREFGGGFDFSLSADGRELTRELIEVGGQRTHLYTHEVELAAGPASIDLTTVAVKPDAEGNMVHLELHPRIRLTGPLDGQVLEYPEPHRRIFFNGTAPADEVARRAYAGDILRRVADRAFRRPVDEPRLERLTQIAMGNDSFEAGIGQAISAILASPKFLFRAETQPQPDDPSQVHPLDEYALASRLSYLLWLSLPDEELTSLAAAGELRENLEAQVRRMLDDPKASRFIEDFPGQWLRTRNVLMTPISRRDGEINHLRHSMKKETEMLFEHIVRNDVDLVELVTADYTFVDKPLADFYGLKNHPGGGFQKVDLAPETRRGGILTHGSFLIATSNPNRTSPVKRGLFVLENLLAAEPPPPPPDTPVLDESPTPGEEPKSVREQLAVHRENKACASCHAHFDPIGLVLENYDIVGKWRDDERGVPIEPDEVTVTGQKLTGIDDLRDFFAHRKDRFYRGAGEKLLTYALGRGVDPMDAPTIDAVAATLEEKGGRFFPLLMAVIESPQFQNRRGDDGMTREGPRSVVPEPPPVEQRKGRRTMRGFLGLDPAPADSLSVPPAAEPAAPANP